MKKLVLLSLLLLSLATVGVAQVTLTHTTTSDFLKGTGNNVIIGNDMVSMQPKMTTMFDFEASTNLPQSLMNHQLVTWQNYVFCVGGYNGNAPVSTVYRATQQSDGLSSWTTMNPLPVPLTDMAVVATQQSLIVMGGKNDDGASKKIYVATLDPVDGTMGEWTESSVVLPYTRWGSKAIVVHDNIYLIGGASYLTETAASKYVYCLKLNSRGNVVSCTTATNLPDARNGHAVATYDSKIYVMGGHDNSGVLKTTVYCATVNLNGTLSSWSTKTALPVALKNHTAVCTNGIMAVIGGMEAELPSSTVYYTYMDNSSLAWTVGGAVLSARTHSGASIAFGNKIFFTGGMNLSGSIVNFTRFAPLETGDAKVGKGCFVSLPYDLGLPMKNVHQLSYNIAQTENSSYEVLYRLAGENLTYGNWISAGNNNPVVIDQTKRAIQYMVRLTATGTDDIQLEDMSATMTGYTQLAGNLNDISVLPIANSPYWATSDITFTTGVHDIDPGVVIYFTKNTGLNITYACVHFNGTESAPILLTYNNDDQKMWRGVYYTGSGSGSNQQNGGVYNNNVSSMNYTVIENAGKGGDNAAVRLRYASQPTFSHCTISNSATRGFCLDYSTSPIISNCTLTNNTTSALYLSNSNPTVTATTMTGNDYGVYIAAGSYGSYTDCVTSDNSVGLYSYTPNRDFTYNETTLGFSNNGIDIQMASGTINGNRTWNKKDNGYWVSGGNLYISGSNSPTLTIAPGNTICLDAGKQIHIGGDGNSSYGGCVYAVGNATDSIHFTAKNGQSGGWGGFYFDNSSDYNSSSALRYCVIEKASDNIYMYKTTQPQLMYSTIRKASASNIGLSYSEINMDECYVSSANNGIYLNYGSTATVVMSTFENHTNACAYHYDTGSTTNFYTCTMKNSNVGVRYYDPNVNIPVYAHPNRVTFNNVTSPVGINGGTISSNYTWMANDYGVFGCIGVENYSSVVRWTIDAGSVLRFAEGKGIGISAYWTNSGSSYYWDSYGKGELYAEGTEENPITFTALNDESGGWKGIWFYTGSDDNATQVSLLKHCIIEKGTTNVYLSNTNQPSIENCDIRFASGMGVELAYSGNNISGCEIHDNGTYGVYSGNRYTDDRLVEITDCNFHDNGNYGLYFRYPLSVGNVLNNLQFSGNLADGIGVGEGTISGNRTWPANEYHIFGCIGVENYSSVVRWTIDAGSVLRFAEGKGIGISAYWTNSGSSYYWDSYGKGELYAEGTEENPITFTALNDESGGWKGIWFYTGSDDNATQVSLLKHCVIEKGTTNVYLSNTNQPSIENCDIKLASGKGVELYYSSPSIKLSRIHSNGTYGIYLDYNCSPTIGNNTLEGNDIVNNGTYAIYQNGSTNIDMAYNFLGVVDSLDIERDLVYDKLDNNGKGRINVFPVSMLPITGNVVEGTMLYDGNPEYTMPGSTVMVKTFADSLLFQTTTDANGHFTIDALNVTGAKKMEFVPNVDVESCITTADALAVMLHYVHESMLTGSRLAAADVNRSFTVNGTDALLIQKRYVNQIETFPNGDMYYHLYDTVAYPIDTCQVAITALCYGDVNGSYHQLRDGVNLLSEGQMLIGPDQAIEIPVRVKTNMEVGAISLKLTYPEEFLEVGSVSLPNGEEVMATIANGLLTISWYDISPLYLSDDEIMLVIHANTKDLSDMNEPISLGVGGYSELADGNAIILGNVELAMPELVTLTFDSLEEQDGESFGLSVYPNPMKDRCTIHYSLTNEGRVSFMVYDLLGNAVKAIEEGRQSIGQHEIELTCLASGVYVGRLVVSGTQEKVQIVKIVVE